MRIVRLSVVVLSVGLFAPPSCDPDPVTQCAANLTFLRAALNTYQETYGALPPELGGAFLLKLVQVGILPPTSPFFDCPVSPSAPPAGSTQYRGPVGDANTYAPTDPIAADLTLNHGASEGGNVLLKNGTVVTASPGDAVWILASVKTMP
jgi:hypothetical protein